MEDEEIECHECGHTFYYNTTPPSVDTEDAATMLLRNYKGGQPSAGDVMRLKERINEILVKEFNVGIGKL